MEGRSRRFLRAFGILWFFLLLLPAVPAPLFADADEGKLRVFVQPVSGGSSKLKWQASEAQFAKSIYRITERFLTDKGFYQIIPDQEVKALLKDEVYPDWRWPQNDWALARQVGKGLKAEYAMVVERGFRNGRYWRMVLINLDTNKRFEAQEFLYDKQGTAEEFRDLLGVTYRKIFRSASADLLATAIRKGQGLASGPAPPPRPTGEPAPPAAPKAPAVATAKKAPAPAPVETRPAPAKTAKADAGKTRLIIYDFETSVELQMAGIIIAEAFREELHHLGRFILINREDMVKALEEHKLKMVGLIEEEGSAEMGKFLMANEMITGKLARLGNTNILQTKRTDIESLNIRNLGSVKCPVGKEEELLANLPQLARQLFELP